MHARISVTNPVAKTDDRVLFKADNQCFDQIIDDASSFFFENKQASWYSKNPSPLRTAQMVYVKYFLTSYLQRGLWKLKVD